jgi:hypothetical protein
MLVPSLSEDKKEGKGGREEERKERERRREEKKKKGGPRNSHSSISFYKETKAFLENADLHPTPTGFLAAWEAGKVNI